MADEIAGDLSVAALTFEQALAELERIVHSLETGEASLEESIDLYTKGTRLKQHCEAKLASAQARIERIQLDAEGQAAGVAPFDAS